TTGSGVNNSGKKVICYNCHGEGHVARQCKEPKHAYDSQWYHDKALLIQAKEKGVVLHAEAEAFLAEVEFDSVLNDNMITYDEYQNDSGVEAVPTVVSADEADKQSMIAVLQLMYTEIAGYIRVNDEHKLVNATLTAELERWHALPINYVKLNALYDQFVPQKELSREHVYWLPAIEIASQSSTPAYPVAPFVHTRPVKSDVHKKVWKIKECITAFEKIIKERTAP
nr:hypothetical protein [Tanacetum cinerariifolium]